MKMIEGGVTAAQGFVAGGIHCGIRKNKSKPDLAMIYSEKPCAAAAVYTQNLVKGAPILVTRKNIADGAAKAVICNSGNANTCNADGVEKAERMCLLAAKELGIPQEDVLVASTRGYRPGAAHRAHRKFRGGPNVGSLQGGRHRRRGGHHDYRYR